MNSSSPPPGLVTLPVDDNVPEGFDTVAGFRNGTTRAIRIDMLERLADLIRTQDARAGFEATPDMLSITGMTLEQFSDLMEGLGYRVERAEREKAKPVIAVAQKVQELAKKEASQDNDLAAVQSNGTLTGDVEAESADAAMAEEATTAESPGEAQETQEDGELASAETAEMETYFVFTWIHRKVAERNRGKPAGRRVEGKKQCHHRKNKPKHQRDIKNKNHHSKPEK